MVYDKKIADILRAGTGSNENQTTEGPAFPGASSASATLVFNGPVTFNGAVNINIKVRKGRS